MHPRAKSGSSSCAPEASLCFARLLPGGDECALEIALAWRQVPDPVQGRFVILRRDADAIVYLGAIRTARGLVREWLEIWLQSSPSTDTGTPSEDCNAVRDLRWGEMCRTLSELDPASAIEGPWQDRVLTPSYLDLSTGNLVSGPDNFGNNRGDWKLCTDETLLDRHGLPSYATSSRRFLSRLDSPPSGIGSQARGTSDQPADSLVSTEAIKTPPNLVPWNPHCGLMFVRTFCQLSLPEFKLILEGQPLKGVGLNRPPILPRLGDPGFFEHWPSQQNLGFLVSGRRGPAARLVEVFLLKLFLVRECITLVARSVSRTRSPFLDLTTSDFRLQIQDRTARIARLWGWDLQLARVARTTSSEQIAPNAHFFFVRTPTGAAPYKPERLGILALGLATVTVRLAQTTPEPNGELRVEGSLHSLEVGALLPNDRLRIELPLDGQIVLLSGEPISSRSASRFIHPHKGEIRFTAQIRGASEATLRLLKAISQQPIPNVRFEHHAPAGIEADLYSIAVIALELMLDQHRAPLSESVNAIARLAAGVSEHALAGYPIEACRARVIENHAALREVLGPAAFGCGAIPDEETELLPQELWWRFIDIISRMFDGTIPGAYAPGLGPSSGFNPEALYAQPIGDLDHLIDTTRGLLFLDCMANREASRLLDEFLA